MQTPDGMECRSHTSDTDHQRERRESGEEMRGGEARAVEGRGRVTLARHLGTNLH